MKPLPEVAAQLAEALAFALETLIRHHAGNTAADGFGMAALAAYRAFMEQPKAEAKSTCGGINCRVASDGTTFHDYPCFARWAPDVSRATQTEEETFTRKQLELARQQTARPLIEERENFRDRYLTALAERDLLKAELARRPTQSSKWGHFGMSCAAAEESYRKKYDIAVMDVVAERDLLRAELERAKLVERERSDQVLEMWQELDSLRAPAERTFTRAEIEDAIRSANARDEADGYLSGGWPRAFWSALATTEAAPK